MRPFPRATLLVLTAGAFYLAGYAVFGAMVQLSEPVQRLAINAAFLVAPLCATLVLARCAHLARGRRRLGWGFIAASTGAWTLGQIFWAYDDLGGTANMRPSLADIGFALTTPLAVVGLILLWQRRTARWFGARAALEGAIVGVSLFLPLWSFVLEPARAQGQDPGILLHIYPVSGVLILTCALLVLPRVAHMDWRRRLLLGLSIFAITLGNALSLLLATVGGYHIGHPIDLLWLSGFLLLAAFAAYRDEPRTPRLLSEQAVASPAGFTYAAVGVAVLSAGADIVRGVALGPVVYTIGLVMVVSLVALQRLSQTDARLLNREVASKTLELERSTERLHLEHVRLEHAQRLAGLGEWTWDPVGRAFHDVADAGAGARATRHLVERRIVPEDRARLDAGLGHALRTGEGVLDLQVRVSDEGEGEKWLRVWTESRGPGGGTVRGLVQDITPLKQLEGARINQLESEAEVRRLREMDKMRATFINVAAHELNTPLTPIKLQLEILRSLNPPTDPDAVKSFDILQRNVQRLANLVVDLLDTGRLQSGRMKFAFAQADLASIAADVVESAHATAERAQVALVFEAHGRLPIRADARRLHEVLDNLLSNALKFTPPGGRIDVLTRLEDGLAVAHVRDSGIGLSPEGLRHLFQPFSQVDRPVRREDSGSGLGLYIARGIMAAHGGTLEVHSDGRGHGSTFTLRLPLAPPIVEARPGASQVSEPAPPSSPL